MTQACVENLSELGEGTIDQVSDEVQHGNDPQYAGVGKECESCRFLVFCQNLMEDV